MSLFKYIIFSGDDGFHSGLNLVLGEKGASLEDLYLNVLQVYIRQYMTK